MLDFKKHSSKILMGVSILASTASLALSIASFNNSFRKPPINNHEFMGAGQSHSNRARCGECECENECRPAAKDGMKKREFKNKDARPENERMPHGEQKRDAQRSAEKNSDSEENREEAPKK